ncbi:ANTAR domain-containing protein, partial [Streptomyces sp. W16]|uniref:ANTAR domain-containing protein n=1 Tax=Streptomyces sp. W16 TaxID=3076631 RepID=UPI00295BACB4
ERSPALLPAARELGVHGVCCFPLGIGVIRIGVLTLLCDGERRLSRQQYTDAAALTAVLTGTLLNGDRHDGGGGGGGEGPGFGAALESPSVLRRAVVHQATGMISAQLDVSIQEALLRLRAHAYSSERPLGEIAADVVARRLRFDDDFDDDVSGPYSPDGGKG